MLQENLDSDFEVASLNDLLYDLTILYVAEMFLPSDAVQCKNGYVWLIRQSVFLLCCRLE
jgi:hypothetical protein